MPWRYEMGYGENFILRCGRLQVSINSPIPPRAGSLFQNQYAGGVLVYFALMYSSSEPGHLSVRDSSVDNITTFISSRPRCGSRRTPNHIPDTQFLRLPPFITNPSSSCGSVRNCPSSYVCQCFLPQRVKMTLRIERPSCEKIGSAQTSPVKEGPNFRLRRPESQE